MYHFFYYFSFLLYIQNYLSFILLILVWNYHWIQNLLNHFFDFKRIEQWCNYIQNSQKMFQNCIHILLLLYELQLSKNMFNSNKNIIKELENRYCHQTFVLNHILLISLLKIFQNSLIFVNYYQTFKLMDNRFLSFYHQLDIQQLPFLRIQNFLDF